MLLWQAAANTMQPMPQAQQSAAAAAAAVAAAAAAAQHARLALQKSGCRGSGRAALHQLMGPHVNASRRWACSWYCRETNTAFLLGSLRVTYLQARWQAVSMSTAQPEPAGASRAGGPYIRAAELVQHVQTCGTPRRAAHLSQQANHNNSHPGSPGAAGQRDALALAHGVEPKAAVVAHHLLRLLLHNRAGPLPKVLPARRSRMACHLFLA